jgi:hypothetical protein
MAIIQLQVGKNIIKDVLMDGGSIINNIIERLHVELRLSKPKPTLYNLQMVDRTITKPLGLINDLKIHVHGIFYTFTLLL